MDEHGRHAERVGDAAGMLAAGAAEAAQRVAGDVVAALNRDLLDGVGHVLDGDAQEAVGNLLEAAPLAGRGFDTACELAELLAYDVRIQRLIAVRAEYLGK